MFLSVHPSRCNDSVDLNILKDDRSDRVDRLFCFSSESTKERPSKANIDRSAERMGVDLPGLNVFVLSWWFSSWYCCPMRNKIADACKKYSKHNRTWSFVSTPFFFSLCSFFELDEWHVELYNRFREIQTFHRTFSAETIGSVERAEEKA